MSTRSIVVPLIASIIVLGVTVVPCTSASPQITAQMLPAGQDLDLPSPPAGSVDQSEGSGVASVTAAPPMGPEIVITDRNNAQYETAVAYNWKHEEYLVVWQDDAAGSGIHARRVSNLGLPLGSAPMALATGTLPQREPAVAYDSVNDRYLVVWMHDISGNGSNWDLSGRFVPWTGSTPSLPEFKIADWPGSEYHPEVAYARGQTLKPEFLIVFSHRRATAPLAWYIAGIRVYADGSGFFPTALNISSGPENRDVPDVTYNLNRNEYVVVWNVWRGTKWDIEGVRLQGNGNPLGSGEFVVANSSVNDLWPSVAACDKADQYLAVWKTVTFLGDDEIRGRSIDGDGAPSLKDIQLDTTKGEEYGADVACNAEAYQYLVVWQEKEQYTNSKFGILGSRVDTNGIVIDTPAFEIVSPSLAPADRHNPAVAAGPQPSYLVSWEHAREGTTYQDIHGRIIGMVRYFVSLPLILRNHE